jgi:choline dehydrogenase-like flavoprotein
MLIDARSVDDGATLECDVCVVGAGPAGRSFVDRLRDSGLSICPAGGRRLPARPGRAALVRRDEHRARLLAASRLPLPSLRRHEQPRGGWCRPLDPLDLEPRDWVPDSGWPIAPADVEAHEHHAAALLQLPDARVELAAWERRLPRCPSTRRTSRT